ncbi:hypothetical protein [Oceanobacillus kimchii]|uniref:hypothetical protein n=1 Tax=Oceanobacillus kimchii TaxID=746691 RepID=UPI003B020DD0
MRWFFKFIWKYCTVVLEVLKEWKTYWSSILVLIIPILISFPSINIFLDKHIWLIFLVILIVIIGWLHSNRNVKNYSVLRSNLGLIENQRDTLSETLESIPTMIVKHLFQEVGLTSKDRITIYRYYDGEFINIGRHSSNLEFAKKGREAYPKDKGFIGKCWQEDVVYVENLPIYENNPDNYVKRVSKRSNIEKGILRKISMKSRSYYCKKLFDTKSIALAVIVIETTNKSLKDNKEKVDEILNGHFGKLLLESIEINLPIGKG